VHGATSLAQWTDTLSWGSATRLEGILSRSDRGLERAVSPSMAGLEEPHAQVRTNSKSQYGSTLVLFTSKQREQIVSSEDVSRVKTRYFIGPLVVSRALDHGILCEAVIH